MVTWKRVLMWLLRVVDTRLARQTTIAIEPAMKCHLPIGRVAIL